MKKKGRRRLRRRGLCLLLLVALAIALFAADRCRLLPHPSFTAQRFGISTIHSQTDRNNNGTDDYTDLLLGARADAQQHPRYKSEYYEDAYPPPELGVCTDVVWRAFRRAGYSLREMVDRDIAAHPADYPAVSSRDSNIDFRRVGNLHVFFARYAVSLSTDINELEQWQPGDIVIFGRDQHIGVVSDKRNYRGQAFIIHNGGQLWREEDYLPRTTLAVLAHYRFDAALIPADVLISWTD